MRTISLFFGVCVAAGVLTAVQPAKADIPPDGLCVGDQPGDPCAPAVDKSGNVVGPGVCVAEQCTRASPNGPMTYACVMCRPESGTGGAGGAASDPVEPVAGTGNGPTPTGGTGNAPKPTAGSAGAATNTAGSTSSAGSGTTPVKPDAKSSDDGGCSVGPGARGTGLASAASLLIFGLARRRRRSQSPTR